MPRAIFLEESIFPVLKAMFCSRAMKRKTSLTSKALTSVQDSSAGNLAQLALHLELDSHPTAIANDASTRDKTRSLKLASDRLASYLAS